MFIKFYKTVTPPYNSLEEGINEKMGIMFNDIGYINIRSKSERANVYPNIQR